jgi:quercetin dioxygenase-like cupin family protein
MYTHSGEEYVYVLSGVITVWLDGRSYTLYPGDSMQIISTLPHNWVNNTNKIAELLSINYPNPFKTGHEAEFNH